MSATVRMILEDWEFLLLGLNTLEEQGWELRHITDTIQDQVYLGE